jgi:hypothetical protein
MTARSEPGHAPVLSGLITTISQFTIVTGITILGRLYPSIAHVGSRASSGHVLSAVAWSSPSPTPPPRHSRCRWPAPGKPPSMLGSDSARPGRTLYGAALEPGGSPVPAATPELKLYGPSRHRTIVPGPSCRSAPDSCQGTDRRISRGAPHRVRHCRYSDSLPICVDESAATPQRPTPASEPCGSMITPIKAS